MLGLTRGARVPLYANEVDADGKMVLVRIERKGTGAMTTVYSHADVDKGTVKLGMGRFAVTSRAYYIMTYRGLVGICRS